VLEPDRSAGDQDPLIVGQIRAPASGTLIQVNAHAHDTVQAGQALFVLAEQGSPMLRLDLVDDDVARLAVGQRATARASDGAASDGVVVDVTPAQRGKPASALVHVDWSATPPERDSTVDLDVVVQHKQNVLLLPSKAVHSIGGRHYVEYMDGSVRRRTSVDVGIASGGYTEIRQGLAEGQAVLISP
jgi:multidrug efflux pump subunit AcrA (membrane-fusion protein)